MLTTPRWTTPVTLVLPVGLAFAIVACGRRLPAVGGGAAWQTDSAVIAPMIFGAWGAYGRTPLGERHSPLTQIRADNVARLQVAWRYSTGEARRPETERTQVS